MNHNITIPSCREETDHVLRDRDFKGHEVNDNRKAMGIGETAMACIGLMVPLKTAYLSGCDVNKGVASAGPMWNARPVVRVHPSSAGVYVTPAGRHFV